jgi:hypothetical protein
MTCCSMGVPVGDISQTAVDWFNRLAMASASTAWGSGGATWWPMYMGWAR